MRDSIHCARLLAFVTGLVNQALLLQNEYLVAENRILRAHLPTHLRLSDPERSTLAEISKQLGRKALNDVARVAKPDTILGWYRKLIAQKFDGSRHRAHSGGAMIASRVRWPTWAIGSQTKPSATSCADTRSHRRPERTRTTTWKEFIQSHIDVLAGTDFFTVEVLTWRGLVTYYVLFSSRSAVAGYRWAALLGTRSRAGWSRSHGTRLWQAPAI
jgi:hypothetical protein